MAEMLTGIGVRLPSFCFRKTKTFFLSPVCKTPPASAIASLTDKRRVINNGLLLMGYQSTGMCDLFQFAGQMRLILETPWLAGRLNDVRYSPLQHEIEPDPAAPYHLNGGLTYRSGPSYYAITAA